MTDKHAGQTARDEHSAGKQAKRTQLVDAFGGIVTEGNYSLRVAVDSGDANVTYVGKAQIGSSESDAVWQIQKFDDTTGTSGIWEDANDSFDNKWSEREAGSFS